MISSISSVTETSQIFTSSFESSNTTTTVSSSLSTATQTVTQTMSIEEKETVESSVTEIATEVSKIKHTKEKMLEHKRGVNKSKSVITHIQKEMVTEVTSVIETVHEEVTVQEETEKEEKSVSITVQTDTEIEQHKLIKHTEHVSKVDQTFSVIEVIEKHYSIQETVIETSETVIIEEEKKEVQYKQNIHQNKKMILLNSNKARDTNCTKKKPEALPPTSTPPRVDDKPVDTPHVLLNIIPNDKRIYQTYGTELKLVETSVLKITYEKYFDIEKYIEKVA